MPKEKSGVHLTGADSGWPVGDETVPYTKNGSGTDDASKPDALSVADGEITDATSANEVQRITPTSVTGGSYVVHVNGEDTAAIPAGAALPTAASLQSALEALPSIEAGDVLVTGSPGGALTVTFKGQYLHEDVPAMTVTDSTTGSGHAVAVSTITPGSP